MHILSNRAFPGFCRNRIFGVGLCNSNRCACNVTAIKLISVLYALVVRLRANDIEITMEDLMPVEILQRFWTEYLEPNGFGGVRTLIENYPTGIKLLLIKITFTKLKADISTLRCQS